MWALKKIDPRLPKKVWKTFEHRLSQPNVSLMEIQAPIFQAVPFMLEELDQAGENCSISASNHSGDPSLAAGNVYGRSFNRYQSRKPPSQFNRGREHRLDLEETIGLKVTDSARCVNSHSEKSVSVSRQFVMQYHCSVQGCRDRIRGKWRDWERGGGAWVQWSRRLTKRRSRWR